MWRYEDEFVMAAKRKQIIVELIYEIIHKVDILSEDIIVNIFNVMLLHIRHIGALLLSCHFTSQNIGGDSMRDVTITCMKNMYPLTFYGASSSQ